MNKMLKKQIQANFQSPLVTQILSEAKKSSIVGVTSHGVFIKINDRWVIFLTYDSFHGPLIINLEKSGPSLSNLDQNSAVEIRRGYINFPDFDLKIGVSNVNRWDCQPGCSTVLNLIERNERIKLIGSEIFRRRNNVGFGSLLAYLLGTSTSANLPHSSFFGSLDICKLHQAIRQSDGSTVLIELSRLLGLGPGLTPSGDDLIIGLLLAINRYGNLLNLTLDPTPLNTTLVEMAYQKTSLISANLIECASLGQGDERLVLALDGMMTGTIAPASCTDLLLSWGNSSGGDAFLGMALTAYQTKEYAKVYSSDDS